MELSHPLLRAPFENVNKSFRLYHKQLTKELAAVTTLLTHLYEEQPPSQRLDVDALIAKLDTLTQQITQLQQDAQCKVAIQQRDLELSVKRARYVSDLAAVAPQWDPQASRVVDREVQSAGAAAQRTLTHRLIANYLLSRGHLSSAATLETATDVGYLVDTELYAESQRIVRDLHARDASSALAWCALNATRLRRLASRLEFDLRLQEFIELVRALEPLAAIEYAQQQITPLALQQDDMATQRTELAALEVAMGTLAFAKPEASGQPHYDALFAAERWSQLVAAFETTFRQVYGFHDPPSLCVALFAGLSTLNTRTCQRTREARAKLPRARSSSSSESDEQEKHTSEQAHRHSSGDDDDDASDDDDDSAAVRQSKRTKRVAAADTNANGDTDVRGKQRVVANVPICPTCADVGAALATGLPFAYHPHSRLVCRVTHEVMDEHNPPRVLPNGRVYSQKGIDVLLQQSTERSGMIRCIETHELFAVSEIKPVYIL